jgi:RNA-directed DNA polymerase
VNQSIDDRLDAAFTYLRIVDAFYEYKLAKWDHLSGLDDPVIAIPVGTDGVGYQAFEKQLDRHARNISLRIRHGTYTFHPFREVDTRKDPKLPLTQQNTRTLGISSIRDALVQSILYEDVLYESAESMFRQLDSLGPVSFAYRKGKSAPSAAMLVHRYAQLGYRYVFDADLSRYFDSIPHDRLLEDVARMIGGASSRTYRLVLRFVRADHTLHKTYKYITRRGKRVGYRVFHYRKAQRQRPKKNEGVPQGGVLSGMLANLYLHRFDEWVVSKLGKAIDLKYVRYADDFVIMFRNPDLGDRIKQEVSERLGADDLRLRINEDKTRQIDIRTDGLDFVGFRFDGEHIRVREKSLEKFRTRMKKDVFQAVPQRVRDQHSPIITLKWLIWRANWKIRGLHASEPCPRCGFDRVGSPRSWMAFFRVVTDPEQLRDLDKWIREMLYAEFHAEFGVRLRRGDLRGGPGKEGLRSLVNESYQLRRARLRPCLCDIRNHHDDIWVFATDMYQGGSFETLSQRHRFTVPVVDGRGLQVSVRGRRYWIPKEVFQNLWGRLTSGEQVHRSDLEKAGIRNTSHVVALMAEFPGVLVTLEPIALSFAELPPARFLSRVKASP